MKRHIFFLAIIAIQSLFAQQKILVGIAGGTASGKTTFAEKLQEEFPDGSLLISQDSYYKDLSHLSIEERAKTNFDHPHSLDFALFEEHLNALKKGQSINQPVYNFHTHCRERETKLVQPAQLIIVDGILVCAIPEIRDLFDLKIFVETDDDIRILRRIERDIKERSREFSQIKDQYLNTVKPMHDAFVAPSKQHADLIVPAGGQNGVALSVILAKLKEDLTQ